MEPNRYEVYVDGDYFIVIDEQTGKQVGKNYKYSRYAYNLAGQLETKIYDRV